MLSNQIKKWLEEGGSFQQGTQLYLQTGHRLYKAYFEQILQRPFVPAAAKETLSKYFRTYLVDHPAMVNMTTPAKVDPLPTIDLEPPPIQQLRSKGRSLLKQRDALRAQLVQTVQEAEKFTEADRFVLAQQIMDELQPQIDEVYTKIRIWQEEGQLPPPASVNSIVQETVEQFKRIMSLRPALSRLKKRYEKAEADETTRQSLRSEIRQKGIELHDLEEALGLQLTVLPELGQGA